MTNPAHLQQLPLAFSLNERLDFGSFVAGPNTEVYERLRQLSGDVPAQVYLWGGSGSGKTHLLQAVCGLITLHTHRAAYAPLSQWFKAGPAALEGLDHYDLVAIDDLHMIAGHPDWEQALFDLYNRIYDSKRSLLFAATVSPRGLGLQLPDLASRLGWGLVFHLQPLSDDDKREALVRRAAARGIELPYEVAGFLLRRAARDLSGLMIWLDHLDRAQLAAQRRLSIPFVKSLLDQTERPA